MKAPQKSYYLLKDFSLVKVSGFVGPQRENVISFKLKKFSLLPLILFKKKLYI